MVLAARRSLEEAIAVEAQPQVTPRDVSPSAGADAAGLTTETGADTPAAEATDQTTTDGNA
jgi:hypothetical protein